MPDVGGNGGVDTSLYPRPAAPSAAGGLGSLNPLQVLGAAQGVAQLRAFQQDQASRQATGQAYQNALQPDGSIDQAGLATALKNDPAAAYGLPDTATKMLAQGGAQFDLDSARNQFLIDGLGSMADDPKLSRDKVISGMVTIARNLRIPAAQVNGYLDNLPKNIDALRADLIQKRNMAIGSAGAATPTDTGLTPEGATITAPRGQYNYRTAASSGGGTGGAGAGAGSAGGLPSALPPGQKELLESSALRAAALQATASTSPQMQADLENLKTESRTLDKVGGPTFEAEKKLNQVASRFGFSLTMTPEQLASGEAFDKTVNQISLRQGQMFGGTDASRSMTLGGTPSTSMSKYGREGVIDLALGNQDAIDTAREEWFKSKGKTAQDFDSFMHDMGKRLDPRLFQFNRLSRENQQKLLHTMTRSEALDFEDKYTAAAHRGWVKELKPNE